MMGTWKKRPNIETFLQCFSWIIVSEVYGDTYIPHMQRANWRCESSLLFLSLQSSKPHLPFRIPASSNRFQVASRLALVSPSFDSSSLNLARHSLNSSGSRSWNILRTFSVKLWTAWFQCFCAFLSNAGNMIGRMTLRLCIIRFSMWLLFHKNKALSATCTHKK